MGSPMTGVPGAIFKAQITPENTFRRYRLRGLVRMGGRDRYAGDEVPRSPALAPTQSHESNA